MVRRVVLGFPSGWSDHSLRWEVQGEARGLIRSSMLNRLT